jgi:Clp amino terminal domain, pathogenicity island component
MMTLDEKVLDQAREARQRLVDLESQTAHARVDYHHAIKKLHAAGGSLREIAEALELSHQRVHQIVEGAPPSAGVQWMGRGRQRRRGKLHRGAFLVRFDAAARQVMVEAQAEADSLRHNYVGTEHIMLALLRRDVGGLGVEADAARREVVDRIGEGDESLPLKIPRPFTPRAKRALEQALVQATNAEHERITPHDLLLAIVSDTRGTGGEILQALGVTPERLQPQPES